MVVDVITYAPSDISFSKINLKNLANYFSYLINYHNENNFRIHDQIISKLVDRMLIEMKLNRMDKFNKLLIVLLEFYNDDASPRKNSEKIKKIHESIVDIMVSFNIIFKNKLFFNC
jgi:hypothetical protein